MNILLTTFYIHSPNNYEILRKKNYYTKSKKKKLFNPVWRTYKIEDYLTISTKLRGSI